MTSIGPRPKRLLTLNFSLHLLQQRLSFGDIFLTSDAYELREDHPIYLAESSSSIPLLYLLFISGQDCRKPFTLHK
jgi:hypothetical protein